MHYLTVSDFSCFHFCLILICKPFLLLTFNGTHHHCPHSLQLFLFFLIFLVIDFHASCFLSTQLIYTLHISHFILVLTYTYIFYTVLNISSCYIERTVVIAFLSNRILRDNVQHPRYEPLRVQILQERWGWRCRVRQKKLWYALVGLCHGVSGIGHFKLKYLTDNPKTDRTCNILNAYLRVR